MKAFTSGSQLAVLALYPGGKSQPGIGKDASRRLPISQSLREQSEGESARKAWGLDSHVTVPHDSAASSVGRALDVSQDSRAPISMV